MAAVCKPTGGRWVSYHDGVEVIGAGKVGMDRMGPLVEPEAAPPSSPDHIVRAAASMPADTPVLSYARSRATNAERSNRGNVDPGGRGEDSQGPPAHRRPEDRQKGDVLAGVRRDFRHLAPGALPASGDRARGGEQPDGVVRG
ncbi:hypothetical protein ACWDNT_25315, partial [Streptomyces sp. NPDC000963]